MVVPLGLSASQVDAMEAQMRGSYRMRVRADLVDMAHRRVRVLTSDRIGGSVQISTGSDASTRSLSLELFDPTDMLGLGDGRGDAVPPNRMIYVTRGIFVDALGDWVNIPVFTGPITKPSRAADVLSIEAQDKVALAINRGGSYTVKAGTNAATAIRLVMGAMTGETRFRLASTSKRLTKTHSVSREQSPWDLVERICRFLGWVCFYDGAGYLVAKPRPTVPVVRFEPGPGGLLTSQPTAGYWESEIKNQVTVIGAVVSKTAIVSTVTLPASHPLSPERLATGNPARSRFLTEYVEDSDVGTFTAAKELAAQRLRELSIQQTTCAFEAAPFWHLEEHDPYTVVTNDGVVTARLSESTIQLSSDGGQSFGYLSKSARQGLGLRVKPKSARLKRAEAKVRAAAAAAAAKKRAAAKKKRK